jgi:hypothetical protein
MTTITFDTLELVSKLKSAGIPQEQAEAVVRVIVEAQDTLVTKDHFDHKLEKELAALRLKLVEHDGQFNLIKWMLGVLLAGVLSLVLKAFF